MYKQNNICKLAAVLASRFSIHEHGAVVKEVNNVRIYLEPPPSLQCEFQTPCTSLEQSPSYTVYNFRQFYFISFQNKLYGCLLDRVWNSWVTYNLKQTLQ